MWFDYFIVNFNDHSLQCFTLVSPYCYLKISCKYLKMRLIATKGFLEIKLKDD